MIHQKEIFKKIGSIVVEINEQYQYLSENPEQLNDLELELFSANADFLSEHVKILRRVNKGGGIQPKTAPTGMIELNKISSPQVAAPATNEFKTTTKPAEVEVEQKEQPADPKPSPTLFEPAIEQVEEQVAESPVETAEPEVVPPMITEEKAPVVEEKQEEIAVAPAPPALIAEELVVKEVVIPEKVTTIDVPEPSSPAPTLNDLISAQKAQSIQTTQFSSQPITDLKTAISLNDKLLFIKDLFNGYSLAYSEAIEILNRFESFDIAETFLKTNYSTKNNWPAKQDTVEKFYTILQRRYTK